MKIIMLAAPCGQKFRFECDDVINGVPINPVLPANFDSTPNEARSDRSRAWWGVPFVRTEANYGTTDEARQSFREHWKGDMRYDVRCLDGGAWDRSTNWGMFGTLDEAVALAGKGQPTWA